LLILKRNIPKSTSDIFAFIFLLVSIHSIALFQLFYVLPTIYSNPEHGSTSDGFTLYYFHVAMGIFIYLNVILNLYKVMTTNTSIRGKMLPAILKPGGWRFCAVCEANAPPRSFHCHICKICILKRDHHCTFTGNCIGLFNQRFYLGLVLFMSIASGYACMLNMDFFYHLFGNISIKTILTVSFPLVSWAFVQDDKMSGTEVFMTSLTLVGFCLSTGLFGYHLMNALNGQSVYERTYNVQDFNLGWKQNIILALGKNWRFALLCPLIESTIPSDGLEFINRATYESLKTM